LTPGFVAEHIVRGREGMARSLLAYAIDARATDWISAAARPVISNSADGDRDLLLSVVAVLLKTKKINDAVGLWNGLADKKAVPFARLSDGSVTNGEFSLPITGIGFDWRRLRAPGVQMSTGPGVRIDCAMAEATAVDLMSQLAPVRPLSSLNLVAVSNANVQGFYWSILSWPSLQWIGTLELSPGQHSHRDSVQFTVPAHTQALRLLLSYRRPTGSLLFNKALTISSVSLN